MKFLLDAGYFVHHDSLDVWVSVRWILASKLVPEEVFDLGGHDLPLGHYPDGFADLRIYMIVAYFVREVGILPVLIGLNLGATLLGSGQVLHNPLSASNRMVSTFNPVIKLVRYAGPTVFRIADVGKHVAFQSYTAWHSLSDLPLIGWWVCRHRPWLPLSPGCRWSLSREV